ncbi:hypothetical protein GGTG_11012 [Gaeumannomyces tritici R3-111a-1]|uniref:Uncharacterized protein n=1 Tax=Gaeumannomyces tritici (strain R3-111a-1) TaxID=644352 RepID=J3PBY8_GAET3|nr:hypothetical protein GGTG_11012 [Gaeumannomyces tritici R3-111a-1]EJT71758.1 hypothetical protein GGTG_11012 [Gaeumannomyces tritici R3-111a-1]
MEAALAAVNFRVASGHLEPLREASVGGLFKLAPQLIKSVAPHIPHIVNKVGNGLKRIGRFVTGKKGKKKGKQDGPGGLAEDHAGGAPVEEADGEIEAVAHRFVA